MTRLMPLFLRQIVPVFAIVETSSQRDAVSFLLCGAGTFRVAADLTLTDPPLCKHHCWCRRSSTRPRLLLPRSAQRPGRGRLRDGRRAPLASAALVAALTAYSVRIQACITDFTNASASSKDMGSFGGLYLSLACRAASPSSSLLCAVSVNRP